MAVGWTAYITGCSSDVEVQGSKPGWELRLAIRFSIYNSRDTFVFAVLRWIESKRRESTIGLW